MSFNIKSKPAKKYFDTQSKSKDDSTEKIQLNFNLLNGRRNNQYSVKIEIPDENKDNNLYFSQLKVCKNNAPLHLKSYICDLFFSKEQKLIIEVFSIQENQPKSYTINTTIGAIVGSPNNKQAFNLGNSLEILEIEYQKINTKNKYVTIHLELKIEANNLYKSISNEQLNEYWKNEKYKLYFKIQKHNQILYESEAFTDDGKFNIVQIPLYLLNSNFDIIFFDCNNKRINKSELNVNNLKETIIKKEKITSIKLSAMDYLVIYNISSIREEITFLDYINNGVKIALDIGIDFTGSNGHPDDFDSLHCRLPNMPKRNPYERAILSCAKIMANYDYDQLFPVYGFGAKIKGQEYTSMCFNINFKKDPNIKFVNNIISEYYACMDKIDFSGPTEFAPLINKIISEIKKETILDYHVLMILTDGIIDDMDETIDALVEGSFLPLSVIIIGIGEADFTKMVKLDGDDIPLISRKGVKRQRDLVQFVPFNKFEGDAKKLAEEVLDEIPRQIIEYYTLNFRYPESLNTPINEKINNDEGCPPPNIGLSSLKMSSSIQNSMAQSTISLNNRSYALINNSPVNYKIANQLSQIRRGLNINNNFSFPDNSRINSIPNTSRVSYHQNKNYFNNMNYNYNSVVNQNAKKKSQNINWNYLGQK